LWVVNDSTETVSGPVRIQLDRLEQNEFRKEIVREVSVAPGKSQVVVRLDEAGIRAFRGSLPGPGIRRRRRQLTGKRLDP
jgi:hypothetical protein